MIPDLTVLWVIAFLLLTTYLLNTLIFQPVLRVIEARTQAVADARELAQSAADAGHGGRQRIHAEAQRGAHRGLSSDGREAPSSAMDKRAALLAETRGVVERELTEATNRVKQQAAAARATLDREADALAGAIVSRVLGRAS